MNQFDYWIDVLDVFDKKAKTKAQQIPIFDEGCKFLYLMEIL